MAQINIQISLDNVAANIDPNQLASIFEGIIKQHTGMEVQTNIYDNDSSNNANPIMARDAMNKIR
jgi:hypothetical protein